MKSFLIPPLMRLVGVSRMMPSLFPHLFAKSTTRGRKAVPKGRPGVPAKIDHFNWRLHSERGTGRPAWTYRGARRNAMKRRAA